MTLLTSFLHSCCSLYQDDKALHALTHETELAFQVHQVLKAIATEKVLYDACAGPCSIIHTEWQAIQSIARPPQPSQAVQVTTGCLIPNTAACILPKQSLIGKDQSSNPGNSVSGSASGSACDGDGAGGNSCSSAGGRACSKTGECMV